MAAYREIAGCSEDPKIKKIAYAAGPGDVAGTYRFWSQGQTDPNEVSETYSGMFFDQIRDLELSALVIASHPRRELIEDGRFTIEHRAKSTSGKHGLSFHMADIAYWLGVMWRIKRAGCDVAIIADMEHWWLLTLLRFTGVRVVPTFHCTFWPRGYRPNGLKDRVIQSFNGWFWRHVPSATICISPECQRQVEEIAGRRVSGLLQGRPRYRRGKFLNIRAAQWTVRPFRLMFAARIEENKGVFDLVAVMQRLISEFRLDVCLEICGDGSAFAALRRKVSQAGLESCIKLHGKLGKAQMFEVIQACHAVIVPTTKDFSEGLNKFVVEGVLAGRPVVATSVCPANELFPRGVLEVRPGDIEQMSEAINRLATDQTWYNEIRHHGSAEGVPFYDESQSWGAAVGRALRHALRLH